MSPGLSSVTRPSSSSSTGWPSSTIPSRGEIHGRDHELALVRGELGRLADGIGAVVVVEGGAGMGKSRLLAEIASVGRSMRVAVGSGASEPGESIVELAALLATLFDGPAPLLDRRELQGLPAQPEQRYWVLRDLEAMLERAALASPLLICIDDAQWADGGTAAALRTLPGQLAGLPIAWVIAVRASEQSSAVVKALDQLKRSGATTIALGPLESDAVVQLAADVLGAEPDDGVLGLVEGAGGVHMWRGEHLSVLGRYDEAFAIAAEGLAAARRDRQGWAYQMFETWRARMLFATGRLSEATATLEGRFSLEDGSRAAGALEAAGIVALGSLALHLGDARRVRRLGDIAHVMLEQGTPAVRRHAGWLLALFAIADGDASAGRVLAVRADRARRTLDPAADPDRHHRRSPTRPHRPGCAGQRARTRGRRSLTPASRTEPGRPHDCGDRRPCSRPRGRQPA